MQTSILRSFEEQRLASDPAQESANFLTKEGIHSLVRRRYTCAYVKSFHLHYVDRNKYHFNFRHTRTHQLYAILMLCSIRGLNGNSRRLFTLLLYRSDIHVILFE